MRPLTVAEPPKLPDVVGQREEDATAMLEAFASDFGFNLTVEPTFQESREEPGTVIEQDPTADIEIFSDDLSVILTIATEPELPNVIGRSGEDSRSCWPGPARTPPRTVGHHCPGWR